MRTGFRQFRLDRILEVRVTDEQFEDEPDRRLEDYFEAIEREYGEPLA